MINSLDQEKITAAMGLLSNVDGGLWNDGTGAGGNQTKEWCDAARAWLASYGRPVSPWPKEAVLPEVVTTATRGDGEPRWRVIDAAGNVHLDPAPEVPDYDEGETGPPEVQA